MNYKYFFSIFLFSATLVACFPGRKILKKTINHSYQNTKFTPESVQKQGLGKVVMTITPIDAASINHETYDAATRDGNYEKELAISIEKMKNDLAKLSKAQRAEITGKINGIEAVTNLEKEKLIPANTAYQLKLRILHGKEYGKDGTEVTALSDVENYADNFNPYKINQKYLSVFKITFENNGTEIEKLKLQELQVVSGEVLLYPLAIEYFEKNLTNESEKVKNAYRMNMPDDLIITPSQRITKYIANR